MVKIGSEMFELLPKNFLIYCKIFKALLAIERYLVFSSSTTWYLKSRWKMGNAH